MGGVSAESVGQVQWAGCLLSDTTAVVAAWTTHLTRCMPSVPLVTAAWVGAWRKEHFLGPVRTWRPLRRTVRRLPWILLGEGEEKGRNTNYHSSEPCSLPCSELQLQH